MTPRCKAEYGRSNGGVMNIVTKSGTNDLHGSFFELFRDKSMNARTETEKLQRTVDKQDYRRNQFGGSFGGPIVKDKAHFFVAVERTQQDTTQAVSTQGLFPDLDGVYATPYRENLFTGKVTSQLSAQQYLVGALRPQHELAAVRRRARNTRAERLGRQRQQVQLDQPEPQLGARRSKLNEFIFQYADFRNHIGAASTDAVPVVPERRVRRPEHQHAADDGAAQVPVPRRLLVARHRHGRPRSRLQGRRQLHQRAAPVHHLQLGQGRRCNTRTSTTTSTGRSRPSR